MINMQADQALNSLNNILGALSPSRKLWFSLLAEAVINSDEKLKIILANIDRELVRGEITGELFAAHVSALWSKREESIKLVA